MSATPSLKWAASSSTLMTVLPWCFLETPDIFDNEIARTGLKVLKGLETEGIKPQVRRFHLFRWL